MVALWQTVLNYPLHCEATQNSNYRTILACSPPILRLFPAGSRNHRETSSILARFIGSHLLGGAGSREDPPNHSHLAALRLRFLHFCFFCVANKHLVLTLRESPGLGACRAPGPERFGGVEGRGRARANRCCFIPGRGPGRGSSWYPLDLQTAAVPAELFTYPGSREPATGASHGGPRGRCAEEGAGAAAAVAAATWAG